MTDIPVPQVEKPTVTRPECECFKDKDWESGRESSFRVLAKDMVEGAEILFDDYQVCVKAAYFASAYVLLGLAQKVSEGKKAPAKVKTQEQATARLLGVSMALEQIAETARGLLDERGAELLKELKK